MQSKVWNRNRKSDKTIQTVSLELDFLFLDKRTNTFRFETFSSEDSSMCCLIDQSSPTLPVLRLPDKPTFVYPVHDRFSLTTSILLPIHNHCPENLMWCQFQSFLPLFQILWRLRLMESWFTQRRISEWIRTLMRLLKSPNGGIG